MKLLLEQARCPWQREAMAGSAALSRLAFSRRLVIALGMSRQTQQAQEEVAAAQ
ncbi:MAG: hypothetical protein V4710_01345 [Verrucomicrobiota bacterium]